MKVSRLFIHAPNIHQGGGGSLLAAMLDQLPENLVFTLLLDSRMPLPKKISQFMHVKQFPPTIFGRIRAEKWLADNAKEDDVVLCFGNLPPLFRVRAKTAVYLQNRLLVDYVDLDSFQLRTKFRLKIERLWLALRMNNVDEYFVQTPTMKELLENRIDGRLPVHLSPFTSTVNDYARRVRARESKKHNVQFLYVASGEPHKNHRRLIEAWCLLAEEGVFPKLTLTLDGAFFSELCQWIDEKRMEYRLRVVLAGEKSPEELRQLYNVSDALIYPSLVESLGLPLIEARQAGLPILASERDYVRDVIDPEESFDPLSSRSIARAVKRFLGRTEPALPLKQPKTFLQQLCG